MTLTVAFDVGPLAGRRTGIGHAVALLSDALAEHDDVELLPYLTSFRGSPAPGTRRLPLPAALAHRLWGRLDHPRVDRWLRGAALVHGTNYVVPPSRLPRLVSVYDCWFLQHPDRVHADVARAGLVLRRAVATGAAVHTTSHASAHVLAELFPDASVHVVPLAAVPLDPAPSRAPIAELAGRPFVLAVATLEQRKNLPRLVAAFGAVAEQHPDLALVLAGGDGDDRPAVDVAIDALSPATSARVLLTGYVDGAARSWLLRNARVLAYPSLDEGFGLPLLDAMQAGVPIVASNAGSIPEVAGEAALYADPYDVDALAEHLGRALVDDDIRTSLITAAPARLQRFSWSGTAAGLVDVYRRTTGGQR
jgi:glycosyltransferase involved in cell wall biosynthesis